MKKIYIALGIFILFLVIALITNNNVNGVINSLEKDTNVLVQSILSNNWNKAKKEMDDLNKKWKIESEKLGILLNHETLENGTISLKKAKKYMSFEMMEDAVVELEQFYFTLDIITNLEIIKLKNIL